MALLSNILRHKPAEWDFVYYDDETFVRIELARHTSEYEDIRYTFLEKFNNATVVNIERVQHPFAYGRYCIRREQLTVKNGQQPKERRMFLPITSPTKIDSIVSYNCDSRRGGFTTNPYISGTGYVLVIKTFGSNFDERDTHRYPDYIIKYSTTQRYSYDDNLTGMFNRLNIRDRW